MDFVTAVKTCLNKYADFSGRARRSEFWFFYLFYVIVYFIAAIIGVGLLEELGGILVLIVVLGLLLPMLSVGVRRLHDTGRSGWWYLISFVPLVGAILLIVWWATNGTPGSNEYGPNPKGE